MKKALIVWRRTGKEHGEDSFRINPPAIVDEHIRRKVELLRATPDENWQWWQLSDEVLVETPNPTALELGTGVGPGALFLTERWYRVTGYDLIPQAIHTAREIADSAHVIFF